MKLSLLLTILLFHSIHSHPIYITTLPNSAILSTLPNFRSLGHQNLETKQLNWFGFDYAGNGYKWTKELCYLDSDGDGQSNGLELGDPYCKWSVEQPNAVLLASTDISHPGNKTSITQRIMPSELLQLVTKHTPVVPKSGYTSLSYVLIPLGIAGVLGMLLTNVSSISNSKFGHNLLQKRLGIPPHNDNNNNNNNNRNATATVGGKKNQTNTPNQPTASCFKSCRTQCNNECSAKTWSLDLLLGEALFLFAVVLGLICLVINKQWNGKYRVANTLGQLAGTLCFLVILPASRSATWIWIFGIPFERAIKWHRLFGKLFIVSTYLHLFVILYRYGFRMLADTIQWGPTVDAPYPYWGLVSAIATGLIGLTTFEAIRRNSFELFYYVHVPMIQIIAVGAIFHAPGPEYRYPVIIAMAFYLFDLLGRFTWRSVNVVQTDTRIDANCQDVVKLRVITKHVLNIGPGDYFFLRFPQISFLQQHPFSVSSIGPHPNDVNFVIKKMGAGTFTNQLYNYVRALNDTNDTNDSSNQEVAHYNSQSSHSLITTMEGPYGHLSIQLERYTKLWICCGGIGAAPMINILMQLHERVMRNDMKLNQLKDVHFVWVVRTQNNLKWYQEELDRVMKKEELNDADNTLMQSTTFHVHLYVTGSKRKIIESKGKHDEKIGSSMLVGSLRSDTYNEQNDNDNDNNEEEEIEIEIELSSIIDEEKENGRDGNGGSDGGDGGDGGDGAEKEQNGCYVDGGIDRKKEYEDGRPLYNILFGNNQIDSDQQRVAMLACGPSSMVAACQREGMLRNWDIHKETFEF